MEYPSACRLRNIEPHGLKSASHSNRDRWIAYLQDKDIQIVRMIVAFAQTPSRRRSAIAISRMGNGWFYLPLAAILLVDLRNQGLTIIAIAGINVGLSHTVYPVIKKHARRPRPFRADAAIASLLPVRDEHSFPSGHMMTLTATVVPIASAIPHACVFSIMMVLAMAWARVASAHHYLSDVCAGVLIGLAIAVPVTRCLS